MICDTLYEYDNVARFDNFNSGTVPVTLFGFQENEVVYTMSMWIKTEGGQINYST
jgi:hypothetical protein